MEFTVVTLADYTALIEHVNQQRTLLAKQVSVPEVQVSVSVSEVSEVLEEKKTPCPRSGDDLYFHDRSRLC
jgi:hypothetical protein